MSGFELIIYIVLGLTALALILFPDFRGKLKVMCGGFLNLFIEDRARTPEGASAIYQQAIEEAQNDYNNAHEILKKVSGQLSIKQSELKQAKTQFDALGNACEVLVKNGRMEEAKIKAEERESAEYIVKSLETAIEKLAPIVEDTKSICLNCEKNLNKLKRDREVKINELKVNQQLEKVYDSMDELKRSTSTRKLLGTVEEGLKSSQERAVGAKTVHENKLSTKIEQADKTTASLATNKYLEELQQKYKK